MTPLADTVLDDAILALGAGLCPIPVARDGTKRPAGAWEHWQHERPDLWQLERWFGGDNPSPGYGLVCGAVSGGLEMLEFEGRAVEAGIYTELIGCALDVGLGGLIDRIAGGYEEVTPASTPPRHPGARPLRAPSAGPSCHGPPCGHHCYVVPPTAPFRSAVAPLKETAPPATAADSHEIQGSQRDRRRAPRVRPRAQRSPAGTSKEHAIASP